MSAAFSPMQKEFWTNCNHRWNVKTGATRSGKTYQDYFLIPKRLLAVSGKDGLNVILGNTRETIRRNVLLPMQQMYGVEYVSNLRSDNSCEMFGQKVFCLGADNANRVVAAAEKAGMNPVRIPYGRLVAIGVCPSNSLVQVYHSLESVRSQSFCPKDAWILAKAQ